MTRITADKRGICYYCMHGEHKRCTVMSEKTSCQCCLSLHDRSKACRVLGMSDAAVPRFPEEPAANDRFFFMPPGRILIP